MTYHERLQQIIFHAEENELPELAPVIGRFLQHHRPETPDEEVKNDWGAQLTSNDIRHALEEVADVSINDISVVMAFAGFEIWTDGCITKWRIRPLPGGEKIVVEDERKPRTGGATNHD